MQEDNKVWYQSRAIWGSILTLAAAIASIFGIHISPEEQQAIISNILAITAAGGGILSLVGRVVAKGKIVAKKGSEDV